MIPDVVAILLVVPLLVLAFYAYQYKNPILLIFCAVIAAIIAVLSFTGVVYINDGSKVCEVVVNQSVTVDASTTQYSYTNYCYTLSNEKLTFKQTVLGSFFALLTLYLLYQATLGLFFTKDKGE